MTIIEHLRMRWRIWRLEFQAESALESLLYHRSLGYRSLAIAEHEQQTLKRCRRELEQICTALANGVAP